MGAKLQCIEVSKQYKDFSLEHISLELEQGYLTGLIGVNGAGKSTLLRILAGIDMHYEGNVQIEGLDYRTHYEEVKQKVGIVSEDISFFLNKTPLDNGKLLGKFFEKWTMEAFYLWLDRLDLPKGIPLGQFSKGMYMKYQLAFAMAYEAKFLFLDEPTSGFDPVFRKDFMKMLQEIRDQDVSILMSTHITSDVQQIADYILMLEDGRLVHQFSETGSSIGELLRRKEV